MSVDSGALAYVQSPGTAAPPPCVVSISATALLDMAGAGAERGCASSTNPPPTLMGGGQIRGELLARVYQLRHESVSLSVEGEVVGALVRAGALDPKLHEDVVEERRRAEPVQLRRQPLRTER